MRREIVVHDVRDAVHINAARGDVRGDEHAHGAGLEILQRAQPLVLRTVRVQRAGLDALPFELARHAVGAVLGAGENEHGCPSAGSLQQMREQRRLQVRRHLVNELRHRFRRVRAAADLHELRRPQKLVRQRLDLRRQRGGKEQRLALFAAAPARSAGSAAESPCRACGRPRRGREKSGWKNRRAPGPSDRASGPGVAMTMSAPERRASICGRSPTPPKTVAIRSGRCSAVGAHVFLDLHDQLPRRRDDERAGAAAPAGADPVRARRARIGSVNAAVLPVPVWAMPMRSWPARIFGIAAAWMGVGSV